jgi:hypothetical protein
MAAPTYPVNPVNPVEKADKLGGFIKSCGIATLDEEVGQAFKWIGVGNTGGDVIVRGLDGNPIYFPDVPAGALRPVLGTSILSAATIDGVAVTTSAAQVVWYGGD